MTQVEIRSLTKAIGGAAILNGVSIDVASGEFLALVGPSGCGKSTILRLIAGLDEPSSGDILIGGSDMASVAPQARNIAMVFQNYALYPHLSVHANLSFGLRLSGVSRSETDRRVRATAAAFELQEHLHKLPNQLSGGQRQRVAMARAIVREPRLVLFDEPLSNLDAQLRVSMRAEIKALHQRLGTTMIYVTHDQVEAMMMADRIAVMRAGQIEQVGAPLEIYDRPVNRFVAGFIGSPSMNMLTGTLAMDGGGSVWQAGCGRIALRQGVAARPEPIVLGVRPEHFELADDGLAGDVIVTEPTGADTHIVVDLDGVSVLAIAKGRIALRPGERVHLRVSPHAAHLFDARDGRRIEARCNATNLPFPKEHRA